MSTEQSHGLWPEQAICGSRERMKNKSKRYKEWKDKRPITYKNQKREKRSPEKTNIDNQTAADLILHTLGQDRRGVQHKDRAPGPVPTDVLVFYWLNYSSERLKTTEAGTVSRAEDWQPHLATSHNYWKNRRPHFLRVNSPKKPRVLRLLFIISA